MMTVRELLSNIIDEYLDAGHYGPDSHLVKEIERIIERRFLVLDRSKLPSVVTEGETFNAGGNSFMDFYAPEEAWNFVYSAASVAEVIEKREKEKIAEQEYLYNLERDEILRAYKGAFSESSYVNLNDAQKAVIEELILARKK